MRYPLFALATLLCLGQAQAAEAALSPAAPPPASAAGATPGPAASAKADPVAAAEPVASGEAEPAGPWIYLVTRVKLTGTDLTQVVFFRHPSITTLEACEAERTAGLTTGWNYFSSYYLRTLRGISYKVDYRCVQGEQHLRYWRQGDMLDQHYLVRTTDGKLQVQRFRNFFACRDALRKTTAEETIDLFCGVGSQALMEPAAATP